MSIIIEFIGYPGSGKTVFSGTLKKLFDKKSIKLTRADKFFFDYYSSGVINKIIFKNFYNYKKNLKFKSNLIFNKQYNYLNNKIKLIIKKNNLNSVITNFASLLDLTDLSQMSKKTALDNFKIDLSTFFLEKKRGYPIYNDEGIIQKVYQLYKRNIKKNLLEKAINKYLKSIPMPDIVIMTNVSFKKSVNNSMKRKKGFKYDFQYLLKTKKNFEIIDSILKKKLKRNTHLLVIDSIEQLNKNFKNLKKYL